MDEKVVQKVVVWAKKRVPGTIWKYGDGEPLRLMPKKGGDRNVFELDYEGGEYITAVSGRQGRKLTALTFMTNTGREEEFGGEVGEDDPAFCFEARPGFHILGLKMGKGGRCPKVQGIIQRPSMELKAEQEAAQEEKAARQEARRAAQEAKRLAREARKAARLAQLEAMRAAAEAAEEAEAEQAQAVEDMKAVINESIDGAVDELIEVPEADDAVAAVMDQVDALAGEFVEGNDVLEEVPEGALDELKEQVEEMVREAHDCMMGEKVEAFEIAVGEEAAGRVEEMALTAPNTDAMEEVMTGLVNEVGEGMFDDFITEMPDVFSDEIEDFVCQGVDIWEAKYDEKAGELVDLIVAACEANIMAFVPGVEAEEDLEETVFGFVDEVGEAVIGEDDFFSVIEVPENFLDDAKDDVLATATDAWGHIQAQNEVANTDGMLEACEAAIIAARQAQYNYEMGGDELGEEAAATRDALVESVEAMNDVNLDLLGDYGFDEYAMNVRRLRREGNQDSAYLATRADYRGANGMRMVTESYARLQTLEFRKGGLIDFVRFTYTDGTVRAAGNEDGGDEQDPLELEAGECISSVKIWATKTKHLAEGLKFETTNGQERGVLTKKTKNMFGVREKCTSHKDCDTENGGFLWFVFTEEEDKNTIKGFVQGTRTFPNGSWAEAVEEPFMDGCMLKGNLNGEEVSFLPLPWEELGVSEAGDRLVVENRHMQSMD